MFRRKFWISLIFTVPAVLYSSMVQQWLGYTAPQFTGHTFVAALFGTLTFVWGGPVFLRGGWSEFRDRKPGMMLLISMGLVVAFGASVATLFHLIDVELWFELATLVTIMLLGHWLEMRAIGKAHGALAALAELLPDEAERIDGDNATTVHIDDLHVADVVLVRPGGRIPADGKIVDGAAEIDEAMITGESRPVPRTVGDRVIAGSVAVTRRSESRSPQPVATPPSPGSNDSSKKLRNHNPGPRPSLTGSPGCCSTSPSHRPRSPSPSG